MRSRRHETLELRSAARCPSGVRRYRSGSLGRGYVLCGWQAGQISVGMMQLYLLSCTCSPQASIVQQEDSYAAYLDSAIQMIAACRCLYPSLSRTPLSEHCASIACLTLIYLVSTICSLRRLGRDRVVVLEASLLRCCAAISSKIK